MLLRSSRIFASIFCLFTLGSSPQILASVIDIFPGSDVFGQATQNLAAGDTLVVHEGTYVECNRMSLQMQGTALSPITIKAADGEARPKLTRNSNCSVQNVINIEGSAAHITIQGIEIEGVLGGDGIKLVGSLSFITLQDLVIHDVDVGISAQSTMHHLTIRDNHIYRTGAGNGTGEGMYIGCHSGNCSVSDSLIERNWVHDSITLAPTQGDGIEIKKGSHSNVIRDNVIHDTHFPCIILYGTQGNPRNIVEGNAMWNCGDSGIQSAADAVIRNNKIGRAHV